MNPQALADGLAMYLCVVLIVTVHEFGHAWMASRCGDDTARSQGRVTLNPLAHLDTLGTVIIPLLMILLTGSTSAWAAERGDAERGRALFNGKGNCASCHTSNAGPKGEPPLFTDFTYDNIGVPKNPLNPFYSAPTSVNRDGKNWVDQGLAGFLSGTGWVPKAVWETERGKQKVPITPLTFGGGQEHGLRPGTLPVPLIVGLGKAAELAGQDHSAREAKCREFREKFLHAIGPLQPKIHGEPGKVLPHTVNASFPGISAEEAMLRLKDLVAVSNGSACTSSSYQPSHVLKAMHLGKDEIVGAVRFSWCHLTPEPDWQEMIKKLRG